MTTSRIRGCLGLWAVLAASLGLWGCSRGLPPELDPSATAPGVGVSPTAVVAPGFGEVAVGASTSSPDLATLFRESRQQLAHRCEEIETTIRRQQQLHLEGTLPYTLLPQLQLPLVPPVFRQARYVAERNLSLPPYLKSTSHDPVVAFHLARFGDLEGAIDLLGPTPDDQTAKLIREAVPDKSYPVEWTRFVALLIHSHEIALASDNKDGAKNLLALHKQLRTELDDKAKKGPLGAALLGRGLGTLRKAIDAWKANGQAEFAGTIEAGMSTLDAPPPYQVALPSRVSELAGLFAAKLNGRALITGNANRVMDLLNLYLPSDDADTAAAFANDAGQVAEVIFTYRPLPAHFQTLRQFAEPIEELSAGKEDDASTECPQRTWTLGDVQLEVTLAPRSGLLGGVARLTAPGVKSAAPTLPRDFGPLHLDRTFETNRRLAAWSKRGTKLVLAPGALAGLGNPLPSRPLIDVVVERDSKHDVVSQVTFEFGDNPKDTAPAAGTIARPLMTSFGRPSFAFGSTSKGAIEMIWKDAATQYRLRFPFAKDQLVSLEATDASGSEGFDRADRVQKIDAEARLERLKSNRPLAVVPRHFDGVKLGMTRAEFERTLPKSDRLLEREIPGGVMAAYLGTPQPGDAVAREWFARFNDDKLTEIRIRYADLPANKPGTFVKIVDALKVKLGPPEVSVDAGAIWADLPKKDAANVYTWHDDLTRLTCRHEPFGLEVTLRDCPASHPSGTPLDRLNYLSRGLGSVQLGMSKADLLKLGAQATEGGAYLVDSPVPQYDAVVAWLDDDKVSRIVARHKFAIKGDPKGELQSDASKALLKAWGADARFVGWPNRQDMNGKNHQSLASRDDQTRFRLFWEEQPHGLGIFSEWKDAK